MIKFLLKDERAVLPTKAHATDSGYDLTAISVHSRPHESVVMLDTGVAVRPPDGYYFDLVARSSLMKKGYFISNCVGVIDSSFRGSIKVPLTMLSGEPEAFPKLPLRGFQLILRQRHDFPSMQVTELDETERGDGGFGSTG